MCWDLQIDKPVSELSCSGTAISTMGWPQCEVWRPFTAVITGQCNIIKVFTAISVALFWWRLLVTVHVLVQKGGYALCVRTKILYSEKYEYEFWVVKWLYESIWVLYGGNNRLTIGFGSNISQILSVGQLFFRQPLRTYGSHAWHVVNRDPLFDVLRTLPGRTELITFTPAVRHPIRILQNLVERHI